MYCIKCGVKLADTESQCPLCQTTVYHPDISREEGKKLYPSQKYPAEPARSYWLQGLLIGAFLLPMLIVFLCDWQYSHNITWAGYVIGALLVGYVILILPTWFKKPNPVIFVPCGFVAAGLYLLYINQVTGGDWFLSFAFPVVGGMALIVTTVVTIEWYVKGGRLFLYGGALMILGGFMLLVEYLMTITFANVNFTGWSLYPLVSLVLLGGVLIFLGINAAAREMMERKFFF